MISWRPSQSGDTSGRIAGSVTVWYARSPSMSYERTRHPSSTVAASVSAQVELPRQRPISTMRSGR